MKRLFLLPLLTVLFAAAAASAQTLIPRAGLTVATNSISLNNFGGEGSIKSQTGFNVGLGVIIPLTEKLSVQPEVNFIQKGFQYEYNEASGLSFYEESSKLKFNYLEIPAMLRFSLGPDALKFHINAGPSVAFGLGGEHKYHYFFDDGSGNTFEESGEGKVKFEDEPLGYEGYDVYLEKRLDIGLQAGAGVTLFNKIMVDIRYGLGLTNITENNVQGDTKNRVIQFTVGVPFSLF